MKKIVLSFLCLTFFSGVFAQSFFLSDSAGNIAPGSTVRIIGDPADEVMEAFINITNIATVAKTVKIKKVIHEGDTLTGTMNTFCWGVCFDTSIYISPIFRTIQPGDTCFEFSGDYRPKTIPGISRIMYVFFDVDNPNDSVAVVVEYNASPASVGDDLAGFVKFSDAYPNPAGIFVNVDYSLPESVSKATIIVVNILGSKVKEVILDNRSGKARIPVSDLINGIYFYSLKADNQLILTRKFVVKR